MAIADSSSATTRLLTLLNVSATKAGKRKRAYEDSKPVEKLNKRRAVQFAAPGEANASGSEESTPQAGDEANGKADTVDITEPEEVEEDEETGTWVDVSRRCGC